MIPYLICAAICIAGTHSQINMKWTLVFVALFFHCVPVIFTEDASNKNGEQIEENPAKLNIEDFARPVGRKTQEVKKQSKINIEDYAHPVWRRIPKVVEKLDQGKSLGKQDDTQHVAKNVQAIDNLVKAYQILSKQVEYLQNRSRVHRTGINSSVDNIPPKYQPRPRQKLHEFFRQLRQKCRVNSPELNTPYCRLFSYWL
ncbi:uncharacterized protein LOC128178054 [Crassostrea angulata]|uniref:uncharacterized protein LOC128178054 n=1 Tax=Magallana angulata TaxID=2784310 RepID=UPI0022B14378|nr:uncharacterized protein LOC128178054 [Crassostrea angulata]